MNGIEKKLEGKAEVIRVNLLTAQGKEIAQRYGVTSAATIVLISDTGEVIYRHSGMPNRQAILEKLGA